MLSSSVNNRESVEKSTLKNPEYTGALDDASIRGAVNDDTALVQRKNAIAVS